MGGNKTSTESPRKETVAHITCSDTFKMMPQMQLYKAYQVLLFISQLAPFLARQSPMLRTYRVVMFGSGSKPATRPNPAQPDPEKPDPHAGLWWAQGSGVDSGKPKPWAFSPMISVGIERHLISCDPLLKQLISDHSFLLDSHVHVASVFCPARLSISISSYNICLSMLFYHGYPGF